MFKSTSVLNNLKVSKLKSPGEYVQWNEDTRKTLEIYGLSHCIDPSKRRFTIPVYPPCSADIRELEFRQKQNSIDEAKKTKSDEQYVAVYFALHDAIPKQNVKTWTKGISDAPELWKKIETMCHYRVDHDLKKFYRRVYEKLRCASGSLGDIINYETAFEGALGDYNDAGGFITMDDLVDKIKEDVKGFKTIYDDLIKFTIEEGKEKEVYPSTNGWTYTQMLERIKVFVKAFDGPDYMKNQSSISQRELRSNKSQKKARFDPRRDYDNENRKKLRDNVQNGDYVPADKRRSVPFGRRKAFKSKSSNVANSYFKKRSFPVKNHSRISKRGYANSIDSKQPESESKTNYVPKAKGNYDVKGNNNKFVNKTKQFKSFAKNGGVKPGARVGNFKNYGASSGLPKRPYTEPYCDICQKKGHYHFQCNNHSKNKDAHPKDGRTMCCIVVPESSSTGIYWHEPFHKKDLEIQILSMLGRHIVRRSYPLNLFSEAFIEEMLKVDLNEAISVQNEDLFSESFYDTDSDYECLVSNDLDDLSSVDSALSADSKISITPYLTVRLDQSFDDSNQEHFQFGSFTGPVYVPSISFPESEVPSVQSLKDLALIRGFYVDSVIPDANKFYSEEVQVRMMMNSENTNYIDESEVDDDNLIIEVPEETEYVKNALNAIIFLDLLSDTLNRINHEETLFSIDTKAVVNITDTFEDCGMSYIDDNIIIRNNKCGFINNSDLLSDRDPVLQRQSQWGAKFIDNIVKEVYNDYPEIMIRDFICVLWGGSHNHTFAELLRLSFHVLEFELDRICNLNAEFFSDLNHMIWNITKQISRIHYQQTTNKLLEQRNKYMQLIDTENVVNSRISDNPLQYLTDCDYDISSYYYQELSKGYKMQRRSSPGYKDSIIYFKDEESVGDIITKFTNQCLDNENYTNHPILDSKSLMLVYINRVCSNFETILSQSIILDAWTYNHINELDRHNMDFNSSLNIHIFFEDEMSKNEHHHQFIYIIEGYSRQLLLQELIKIGRRINKELNFLGSMKFAVMRKNNPIKLGENDEVFTSGNILHLKCYIYKIFGDLYMKNQLTHRSLMFPVLQSLLSTVNDTSVLAIKQPFQYGPQMMNYFIDVDINKPYTNFSVVLVDKAIRRLNTDGVVYDIIEKLTPTDAKRSVLALIPTVLLNQVGSLTYDTIVDEHVFQETSVFSNKNHVTSKVKNHCRDMMQLVPIKDIPFQLKNIELSGHYNNNDVFDKVISYLILDAKSMIDPWYEETLEEIEQEFLNIRADDIHIRIIPENLLKDNNTINVSVKLNDSVTNQEQIKHFTVVRVKATQTNIELLFDYDPFNRLFCKHVWRTGLNETIFPIYDPKSIIRINAWNEISYEYKLSQRVYDYLSTIQSEYKVLTNKITEDDFCIESVNTNHPPQYKCGVKPLILEILSDLLILNVYEYKSMAMPHNYFQFAIRYKDDSNYFYLIDTKNCSMWKNYLCLKESLNLKYVNHNGSPRNTNAMFDLKYSTISELTTCQDKKYVDPTSDKVILDESSYCSDNAVNTNQTMMQNDDEDNNINNNDSNNNSSNNRKRKGHISEENKSTRDIIDNSFSSRVTRRNFNVYDNYDGRNQIREGEEFEDVILISYDRSSRSNNSDQRDLSFGLMFLKRNNDYLDDSDETLEITTYPYDSNAYSSTNMECFGSADNAMATPRFKIPVRSIHIRSNNITNRNIFGSANSYMGVAMYPLNDFSEYSIDDPNRDYRYDITSDECEKMGFYYLVSSDNLTSFNQQTRNSYKTMSNHNFIHQRIDEPKIGVFIQENNNILRDMINEIEIDYHENENILDTNFIYNNHEQGNGNYRFNMKPLSHSDETLELLIQPKEKATSNDEDFDIYFPNPGLLVRRMDNLSNRNNSNNNNNNNNSSNRNNNNNNQNNPSNNVKDNTSNKDKDGYCSMIRNIIPQFLTKITIETNLPTADLSNLFNSKNNFSIREGSSRILDECPLTISKNDSNAHYNNSKIERDMWSRKSRLDMRAKNFRSHCVDVKKQRVENKRCIRAKNYRIHCAEARKQRVEKNAEARKQRVENKRCVVDVSTLSNLAGGVKNSDPQIPQMLRKSSAGPQFSEKCSGTPSDTPKYGNSIQQYYTNWNKIPRGKNVIGSGGGFKIFNKYNPPSYKTVYHKSNESDKFFPKPSFNTSQKEKLGIILKNHYTNHHPNSKRRIITNSDIQKRNTVHQEITNRKILKRNSILQETIKTLEQKLSVLNQNINNVASSSFNRSQSTLVNNVTLMMKPRHKDKNNITNRVISTELALVDTGSTNSHMIKDYLFDTIDYNKSMSTEVANGEIVKTSGEGTIGSHKNICYTPEFSQNILSVSTLTEADDVVCFSKSKGAFTIKSKDFDFNLKINKKLIKISDMYYINIRDLKESHNNSNNPIPIKNLSLAAVANNHPPGSIILWHQRLHLSNNYIKRLVQLNLVIGLSINDYDMKRQLSVCESCMYSKFTRNSFFKKYEVERRTRFKIAKKDQKAFNDMKKRLPLSSDSLKFNKYPDKPLSEFDSYDKNDMIIEDPKESDFVKIKYNPLQNNLVGDIYAVIAVDLKGPFNIEGFNGERYFMVLIDIKASMQAELYMIPDKNSSSTSKKLTEYVQSVLIPNRKALDIEYQFSIFHSDNGSEFMKDYARVCKHFNLRQTFTVSHTPEQNAVVERYWRSLMGPMLAMMFSAKLDKRLWPYCASYVNEFILNKLRIITYKGKVTTTYNVITSEKPNIEHLKTWGCEVFALDTRKYDPRHFTEKAFKGYLVGYDSLSKSALVFDPLNDEIIMTNHIKYAEIVHGIRDVNNISIVNLNFQAIKANQYNKLEDKFYTEPFSYWDEEDDTDLQNEEDFSTFVPENGTSIGNNHVISQKLSKRTRDRYEEGQVNAIDAVNDLMSGFPTITLGSLNYEENYKDPNDHPVNTRLADSFFRNMYLNDTYVIDESYENISFKAERRITIPEAINGPDKVLWRKAIQDEYDGQDKLNSFTVAFKPDGIPLLDWILIFKRKFDDKGAVEKYKVRATVRGDKQVEDADYFEIFAPVGKLSSLRIFTCLVAYYGFEWIQVDYVSAFLQADFDENHTIHLSFPPLYDLQNAINQLPEDNPIRKVPMNLWTSKLCLKMNKSIYGLKQAPKAWYDVLNKSLISMGFKPLQNEPCIFIFTRQNGDKYFLFLYVDDTLIAGKEKSFIDSLVKMIQAKHSIKILGEPKFILGLKLTRCNNGNILIDQNQYIKDVAARFDVVSNPNKIIRMPCTTSQFKRIEDESKDEKFIDLSIDIRSMVGSLMYASLGTRPDITYFVNYISRYLTKPTVYIKKIVLQAINYLLDTPYIYIICYNDYTKIPQTVTFVDAGHASEVSRKGITGNILKFGKTVVIWNSTKQSTYSLSTAETEYKALSETLKETLYMKALMEELGLKQDLPLRVYEDNTATIAMSNNPIINKKSKHIELAFHFFKDFVQQKVVQLFYIASKNQEADLLTKVVNSMDLFYSLVKKIFNLETITITSDPNNKTLMINSKQSSETIPELNRKERLQLAYIHLNNPQGYRYINSDEYNINRIATFETKDLAFQEWISDFPFTLLEMSQLADILAADINYYAKEYQRFFPKLLLCNDKLYTEGFEKLKQYHQFMEDNVYSINIMRNINKLMKNDKNISEIIMTKTEVESMLEASIALTQISNCNSSTNNLLNTKSNGSCNMINTLTNMNSVEETWLNQDTTYQNAMARYLTDNFKGLPSADIIALRNKAKELSLKRLEKYLSENVQYIATIKRYNDLADIDTAEREHLIEQAKLNTIGVHNVLQSSSSNMLTDENYKEIFPTVSNSSSVQPKASLQAIAEEYNAKQPTPQPLKKLKRGIQENPPQQTTNKTDSSQPIQQIHHAHKRLTDFEKNEFISLVHRLHLDIYNAVITYMVIASNIVDTEATVSHHNKKKKSSNQREHEYDDERRRARYEKRFESQDDENYNRDRNHHDMRNYYSNDRNNHYDNKNNRETNTKLKSRGTAISDQNNNNNTDHDNNDNNNNDNEEEEEEKEEEE